MNEVIIMEETSTYHAFDIKELKEELESQKKRT